MVQNVSSSSGVSPETLYVCLSTWPLSPQDDSMSIKMPPSRIWAYLCREMEFQISASTDQSETVIQLHFQTIYPVMGSYISPRSWSARVFYFLIMFISLFVSSLSSPPSSVLLSLHQRAFPLHRSNCYLGCGKLRVKHLIFRKQLGVRHQWHVYKDSPGRPHLTLCFRKVWLLKSSSAERQGMVTCALCPVKTAHECLACSDYE